MKQGGWDSEQYFDIGHAMIKTRRNEGDLVVIGVGELKVSKVRARRILHCLLLGTDKGSPPHFPLTARTILFLFPNRRLSSSYESSSTSLSRLPHQRFIG